MKGAVPFNITLTIEELGTASNKNVDVLVSGTFYPGEPQVRYYADGSGYPGSPDEIEWHSTKVLTLYLDDKKLNRPKYLSAWWNTLDLIAEHHMNTNSDDFLNELLEMFYQNEQENL